jgi:FAD/FMN-containing dehydrogenase
MTLQLPARVIDDATGRALRARLHGEVILPGDRPYDEARQVHNASIDRHPAVIVRAADPADVIRTVALARETGLPLAVRGGGHSVAGHSTSDGIVLDLSAMRRLMIDPERRLAWAEAGLTAGEYTTQAHAYGLATPFGDTASVGIAGLTLGGGIGYLARKHGLAIDSLVSVEMVTADGRLVTASEDDWPDLFWAVRGGGGNFGVVTGFQYRLHPVGTVYGGLLALPATTEVLREFGPAALGAPDGLTTIAAVMHAPRAPFVPADQVGRLVLAILAVHAGDPADGEQAVASLRSLARPVVDTLGPMPYPAIYAYSREAEARAASAVRSMFMASFDDAAVEATLDFMGRATSPAAMAQLRPLGGAMARVGADATAFVHRDRPYMMSIITPFVGPTGPDVHTAWTESFYAALRPSASGVYVNFLGDEGETRIHEAYSRSAFDRLSAIKRRYDPENLFRLNQNIRPAA